MWSRRLVSIEHDLTFPVTLFTFHFHTDIVKEQDDVKQARYGLIYGDKWVMLEEGRLKGGQIIYCRYLDT